MVIPGWILLAVITAVLSIIVCIHHVYYGYAPFISAYSNIRKFLNSKYNSITKWIEQCVVTKNKLELITYILLFVFIIAFVKSILCALFVLLMFVSRVIQGKYRNSTISIIQFSIFQCCLIYFWALSIEGAIVNYDLERLTLYVGAFFFLNVILYRLYGGISQPFKYVCVVIFALQFFYSVGCYLFMEAYHEPSMKAEIETFSNVVGKYDTVYQIEQIDYLGLLYVYNSKSIYLDCGEIKLNMEGRQYSCDKEQKNMVEKKRRIITKATVTDAKRVNIFLVPMLIFLLVRTKKIDEVLCLPKKS